MPTIERIRHPLALRRLRVRRVEELAPRMRRIVLASDELADQSARLRAEIGTFLAGVRAA